MEAVASRQGAMVTGLVQDEVRGPDEPAAFFQDVSAGVPLYVTAVVLLAGCLGGLIVALAVVLYCKICIDKHVPLKIYRKRMSDVEKYGSGYSSVPRNIGKTEHKLSDQGIRAREDQRTDLVKAEVTTADKGISKAGQVQLTSLPTRTLGGVFNTQYATSDERGLKKSSGTPRETEAENARISPATLSLSHKSSYSNKAIQEANTEHQQFIQNKDNEKPVNQGTEGHLTNADRDLPQATVTGYRGRRHTDGEYKMGFQLKDLNDVAWNAADRDAGGSRRHEGPTSVTRACTTVSARPERFIRIDQGAVFSPEISNMQSLSTSATQSISLSSTQSPEESSPMNLGACRPAPTRQLSDAATMTDDSDLRDEKENKTESSSDACEARDNSCREDVKVSNTSNGTSVGRASSSGSEQSNKSIVSVIRLDSDKHQSNQLATRTKTVAVSKFTVKPSGSRNIKTTNDNIQCNQPTMPSATLVRNNTRNASSSLSQEKHEIVVEVQRGRYSSLTALRRSFRICRRSNRTAEQCSASRSSCKVPEECFRGRQKFILLEVNNNGEVEKVKNLENRDWAALAIARPSRSTTSLPSPTEVDHSSSFNSKYQSVPDLSNILDLTLQTFKFKENLELNQPQSVGNGAQASQTLSNENSNVQTAASTSNIVTAQTSSEVTGRRPSHGRLVQTASGEISRELWGLRAILERTDPEQMDSDESEAPPETPAATSCSQEASVLASGEGEERLKGGSVESHPSAAVTPIASPDDPDDSLRRVPSVRRQKYRNAIAKRQEQQQQQRQQKEQKFMDLPRTRIPADISSSVTDTESSLSFERSGCSTVDSFRSSDGSTESAGGEVHGHRLEQFRGDSGYKSLEAQQSLQQQQLHLSGTQRYMTRIDYRQSPIRPDHVINEDVQVEMSESPVGLRGERTPGLHGSATPSYRRHSSGAIVSLEAERRRIAYKFDRQLVQNYDSLTLQDPANEISGGVSDSELRKPKRLYQPNPSSFQQQQHHQQRFQQIQQLKYGPQFSIKSPNFRSDLNRNHRRHHHQQPQQQGQPDPVPRSSSLFSRLLKSHTRNATSSSSQASSAANKVQRDYSIDERTDALFNKFLEYDPNLETKHTLCVSSRRSPRQGRYRHHRPRHPPLPSQSTSTEEARDQLSFLDGGGASGVGGGGLEMAVPGGRRRRRRMDMTSSVSGAANFDENFIYNNSGRVGEGQTGEDLDGRLLHRTLSAPGGRDIQDSGILEVARRGDGDSQRDEAEIPHRHRNIPVIQLTHDEPDVDQSITQNFE